MFRARPKYILLMLTACNFLYLQGLNASKQVQNDLNLSPTESALTAAQSNGVKHTKNSSKQYISNSWKPYFEKNKNFENTPKVFCDLNFGAGFLYFDKVRGGTTLDASRFEQRTKYMQGRFVCNRTPLYEGSIGCNLSKSLSFLSIGLSVLYQSNVELQSYNMTRATQERDAGINNVGLTIFQANLQLAAAVAKFYVELPYSMIWKRIAYTPFVNLSVGPSWQTWSNISRWSHIENTTTQFRQRISANCFFGTDAGIKLRSLLPSLNFSLQLGCKFNLWGQARQMGTASQGKYRGTEGSTFVNYFMNTPWSVKTIYQWAPFIGFNWSF